MKTGRIQIFAKAPIPGSAKSRLTPILGSDGAAQLQAQFIRHTLTTTTQLPLPTELWCTPDINHPAFDAALRNFSISVCLQEGGDLGARMNHAFEHGLTRGGPVVLIGTDCPALSAADLQEAFIALTNGKDVVLGPSVDGGYYLIGLNNPQPQLFSEMPWSTSTVLSETCARLSSGGLHWHQLRMLNDIDTPADLIHLPHSFRQAVTL